MKFLFCHSVSSHMDFLDSGSYLMDGIIALNDHILYYEIILLVLTFWMLFSVILKNNSYFSLRDLNHGSLLEIIWTLLPGVVLILIALPSFRLLYLIDDFLEPSLSIKVIGSQWYWNYAYGDNFFESYLLQDLNPGIFRLLDTDEHLIVPANTTIRFLITGSDVIHSWSIPALGIKTDAIPGRINQTSIEIYRPGLYFGQCYELCGIQHAFMPITLKVV
jgi:cytochrome c oxidase subunit 2